MHDSINHSCKHLLHTYLKYMKEFNILANSAIDNNLLKSLFNDTHLKYTMEFHIFANSAINNLSKR